MADQVCSFWYAWTVILHMHCVVVMHSDDHTVPLAIPFTVTEETNLHGDCPLRPGKEVHV